MKASLLSNFIDIEIDIGIDKAKHSSLTNLSINFIAKVFPDMITSIE